MLTLRGVSRSYGSRVALDGVVAEIGPGVTALLGPNGAGKTTLVRILATAQLADAGEVSILGLDPRNHTERLEIRRQLGYYPQEPGHHPGFTVFEFVDYVAILKEMTDRKARHREVGRVIEQMGLSDRARSRVRSLSGGMKRRMILAQALLGSPRLLMLDEPTAGLDPEQRLRFREIASEDPGRIVVLATHQTEDVAALCRRVIVLLEGQMAFAGSVEGLRSVAAGHVWTSAGRGPGARLAWRSADGTYRNIGDPPASAPLTEPTLEDGYLMLVGESGLREADAA